MIKYSILLILLYAATSKDNICSLVNHQPLNILTKNVFHCSFKEHMYMEFLCEASPVSYNTPNAQSSLGDVGTLVLDTYVNDFVRYSHVGKTKKINFVAPPEHQINGQSVDLEMRIHFENLAPITDMTIRRERIMSLNIARQTSLNINDVAISAEQQGSKVTEAVVSLFFKIESGIAETDFFGVDSGSINLNEKFQCLKNRFYYRYRGGLTEGSCPKVEWVIGRDVIKISQSSFDKIKAKISDPSQQPVINQDPDRDVTISGVSCYPAGKEM